MLAWSLVGRSNFDGCFVQWMIIEVERQCRLRALWIESILTSVLNQVSVLSMEILEDRRLQNVDPSAVYNHP